MASVEDRLTAVEFELARLRQQMEQKPNWIARITGSMKDFPEFEDLLELGSEWRRNDGASPANGKDGD
jgi:hypothetical protein